MHSEKNSILIVDDEALNIKTLTQILEQEYTVYAEKDSLNSLDTAKKLQPDLILLDVVMPNIDGFEVMKNLKADKDTENIPVMFITGLSDAENEIQGFALGAVDYIHKPFIAPIVKMRIRSQMKIVNLLQKVQNLIVTDFLTGIGNRRYFNIELNREWERAKRQQSPISFILMDVDDFKKLNDTHGHLNGDSALQLVADVIKSVVTRASDKAARWGGEEFAVILPDTVLAGASKIAEDIRAAIESNAVVLEDKSTASITVSMGIHSVIPERGGDYNLNAFVSDADKALYQAKSMGKNRVCIAGD